MDDGSTHRIAVAEQRGDVRRPDGSWQFGLADRAAPAAPRGKAAKSASAKVVALPHGFSARLGRSLMPASVAGIPVTSVPAAMVANGITLETPAEGQPTARGLAFGDAAKQVFDRFAALFGLVLLLPIMAMIAALIWLRDPGPVLFGHVRIGRGGQRFRCLKFRTMVRNGDEVLAAHLASDPDAALEWAATRKLKSDPRVTPLGRVFRKTSLDELPQLLNVLKGEMSLVGPRPIVEEEAHYYGPAMRDYTAVRPGVTGLWQIGGRSDTSYTERVRLDQTYVQNRSFGLDLKILAATVLVVLRGRGSY